MTASRGTSALADRDEARSKPSGTFTRANRSSPVSGSRASTPSESESPEMYGNDCPGPTPSGVRTGKISRSKYACSRRSSLSVQSSIRAISIPAAASDGRSSRRQRRACRPVSSTTLSRIAATTRTPRPSCPTISASCSSTPRRSTRRPGAAAPGPPRGARSAAARAERGRFTLGGRRRGGLLDTAPFAGRRGRGDPRLAAEGPPEEEVGLAPYASTGPTLLPVPAVPVRGAR